MNKLRKGPPGSGPRHNSSSVASSRTLQLAQDVSVSLWPARSSVKELSPPSSRVEFLGPSPTSSSEQYWAARALSAETLLAAREAHHKELKELLHAEELKRAVSSHVLLTMHLTNGDLLSQRDISTITQEYKEKHTGLEKLVASNSVYLRVYAVTKVSTDGSSSLPLSPHSPHYLPCRPLHPTTNLPVKAFTLHNPHSLSLHLCGTVDLLQTACTFLTRPLCRSNTKLPSLVPKQSLSRSS